MDYIQQYYYKRCERQKGAKDKSLKEIVLCAVYRNLFTEFSFCFHE